MGSFSVLSSMTPHGVLSVQNEFTYEAINVYSGKVGYWFNGTDNHRLSSPDLSLGRLIWASLCDSYSQALSIAMRLCSWRFSSGRFICKDRLPVPLNVAALKPLGWPEAHWLHLIKLPVRKATASCLLQHCSKPLIGRKNCLSDKLQEASTQVFM